MGADLHAFGFIGPLGDMRALALLGVDRSDRAVLALDEIHLGDDAEPIGGERHRAGDEIRLVVDLSRRRQLAAAGIDAHMRAPAFLGVAGICPLRIDPFEKSEARTVDVLVDHTHRHERGLRSRRWGGEFEG